MLLFTINFFYKFISFKRLIQPDTWCIKEVFNPFITNRLCKKKLMKNIREIKHLYKHTRTLDSITHSLQHHNNGVCYLHDLHDELCQRHASGHPV